MVSDREDRLDGVVFVAVAVMIKVGPVVFHLYGLLIGLGVLAGTLAASKKNKYAWEAMFWAVGLGVIGARIYHVIDWWSYYSQHLSQIPALWQGGMGIYGGILGGILGLLIYSRNKQKFLKLLDAAALGLPLGQAIGRLGNFFNQELYGLPTNLPWGIYIRPENRLIQVMEFERFHPLFLYESLWCLVIFLVLLKLVKKNQFIIYLGLYGLGRFFLEWLRIEAWTINGVNVAQMISVGLMIAAFIWWLTLKYRNSKL